MESKQQRGQSKYIGRELIKGVVVKGYANGIKDFSHINLNLVCLNECILNDAIFYNAFLIRAQFKDAFLLGANFTRAFLNSANLHKASLICAILNKANLTGANLSGAVLDGAHLCEARLNNADLKEAHLFCADLRGADLRGADLRGADLRGADLRGAKLGGVKLEGAKLGGVKLEGAKLGDIKRFRENPINKVPVVHIDLRKPRRFVRKLRERHGQEKVCEFVYSSDSYSSHTPGVTLFRENPRHEVPVVHIDLREAERFDRESREGHRQEKVCEFVYSSDSCSSHTPEEIGKISLSM